MLFVDFWASWCSPCRADIPHIKEVYEKYKDKGLNVLAISFDSNKAAWKSALKKLKMPWEQLIEVNGTNSDLAKAYQIYGIPYGILLDSEGTIIAVRLHAQSLEEFLLKEGFLDNAKLKYTGFSYKYYEEHPYKYSMLGLSMMLNDYGIANKGVRTQTKDEAVKELVPPYIAHINHDFVNVYGKTDEKIFYIWRGVDIKSTYNEFVKVWDGIALIAEPDETPENLIMERIRGKIYGIQGYK